MDYCKMGIFSERPSVLGDEYLWKSSIRNENHDSYKFIKTQPSFDFLRMSCWNHPTTTATGVGASGDGGGLEGFISTICHDTQEFFESHRVDGGWMVMIE